MKSLMCWFAAALLLATTSACFRTQVILSRSAAQSTSQIDWESKWYHDAIYGLAEISGPVRLERVCPGGVAQVQQETSFINGLVQWITGNLYNPQEVTIYCLTGAAARVQLDDAGRAIAYLDEDNQPTSQPVPRAKREIIAACCSRTN